MAAGALLIQEAGGLVADLEGESDYLESGRIVAGKAADTAWLAHKKIEKHQSDVRLGMRQREITLKYRRPSAQDVAEARSVLAIKDEDAIEKLFEDVDKFVAILSEYQKIGD
jgi:hypothetical protein